MKQLHDVTCVFDGLDGVGAIYISGITGAKNVSLLRKNNIKAVICAARSGYLQYQKNIIEEYLYIPADDYQQFDLSQYFQKAFDFIEKNRKKTNVLVHCMAGISRSATLVVAYLIKKYAYSMDSILSLLKRKRSIINPNQGFLKQLKSIENNNCTHKENRQLKKILNDEEIRSRSILSGQKKINKSRNKSISTNHKRYLSKESKDFLESFNKNDSHLMSFHKRKSSLIQNYKPVYEKENKSHLKLNKPQFYSSQLGHTINVAHIHRQVLQIKEKIFQNQSHTESQSTVSSLKTSHYDSKQPSLLPQKTQSPLSERLNALKANFIKQYKLNKQKHQNQMEQAENQEENELDLSLAIKILKNKPKRHPEKKSTMLLVQKS